LEAIAERARMNGEAALINIEVASIRNFAAE
jgi:hypothetical protein